MCGVLPWQMGVRESHWYMPMGLRTQVALLGPTMRYPGLQKYRTVLPTAPTVLFTTPPFFSVELRLQYGAAGTETHTGSHRESRAILLGESNTSEINPSTLGS